MAGSAGCVFKNWNTKLGFDLMKVDMGLVEISFFLPRLFFFFFYIFFFSLIFF